MTAAITGTAGGIVSNKIAVVAAVLELPTESTAVTLKLFAPSFRLTDACQVVDDRMLTPVVPPLTLITAASDAFVPVRSCEVTFVGDVTALITGTAGGIVSSVMAVVAAVLSSPIASSAVTLKLLFPSVKLTDTCQVVDESMLTPVALPFTFIAFAIVVFVPVRSWVVIFVGEFTALMVGAATVVVTVNLSLDEVALIPPEVVTVISNVPIESPDGMTAPVIVLSFEAVYTVSVVVPRFMAETTLLLPPPKNPEPAMFSVVETRFEPLFVLILLTTGTGVSEVTVYLSADEVALVPPRAVIVTS